MSNYETLIGEPQAGEPNPELERISGSQKVFILFIAAGLMALIGLLAYLPSVAAPLE